MIAWLKRADRIAGPIWTPLSPCVLSDNLIIPLIYHTVGNVSDSKKFQENPFMPPVSLILYSALLHRIKYTWSICEIKQVNIHLRENCFWTENIVTGCPKIYHTVIKVNHSVQYRTIFMIFISLYLFWLNVYWNSYDVGSLWWETAQNASR